MRKRPSKTSNFHENSQFWPKNYVTKSFFFQSLHVFIFFPWPWVIANSIIYTPEWIVILSIYISFDHFCYDWSLLYIIPSQAAFFHLILFSTSFLFCAQHNFDGFDSKRREEMLAWKCFNGYPLWLWHDIDTNDTLQPNTQLVFS